MKTPIELTIRVLAALVLPTAVSAAPARAAAPPEMEQTGADLVAQARILYEELEYDAALEKLKAALEQGGLARRDIVAAYKYMGFIYLMKNQPEYARAAFQLLLRFDPGHRLDPVKTPPKFVSFFEQVRKEGRDDGRVKLKHTSPEAFRAGAPMELVAWLVDPDHRVATVKAYYRTVATSGFSSVELAPDPADPTRWVGAVPYVFGEQTGTFDVEYYLAALAEDGEWLATAGSPKAPLAFQVVVEGGAYQPEEPPGLLSQWWFWAAVGGVVAAGAGGAVLATQLSPEPPTHGGANVVIR